MEMMKTVLGEAGSRGVVDDSPLRECRRAHTPLHTLDQLDVFDLKHFVEVSHRFDLGIVGLGRFEKEVVGLERAIGPNGDDV